MNKSQEAATSRGKIVGGTLLTIALASLWLVVHNYGCSLLPSVGLPVPQQAISAIGQYAYAFEFSQSEGDVAFSPRNRARLSEGGTPLSLYRSVPEIMTQGGGRWIHESGRIVFSSTDNSDPRTNGRAYVVTYPFWDTPTVGRTASAVFLLSLIALTRLVYRWSRKDSAPVGSNLPAGAGRFRLHLGGALIVFSIGLYCNTGTLAPCGITGVPYIEKDTGYFYNQDHPHFEALFAFVDQKPTETWNRAILLRRILYPILAWPFMKVMGFSVGGTIASVVLNVLGLAFFLVWVKKRIGESGVIFVSWILALSPGAAYWAGVPYVYSLIFPGSLLLMCALFELDSAKDFKKCAVISLAMGVLYLAYDFAAFFLPASIIVLIRARNYANALLSAVAQLAPTIFWLWVLRSFFGQAVLNDSTNIYRDMLFANTNISNLPNLAAALIGIWDIGWSVFFGANFIFLPALFLFVCSINPVTSRIRFQTPESALLFSILGVLVFCNLSSDHTGWDMHGSWISRIYQPAFAAFITYLARWWQSRPAMGTIKRGSVLTVIGLGIATNGLIVFGPLLKNPLGLSGFAYYRFYDNTDSHETYDANLKLGGSPRPLGFPRYWEGDVNKENELFRRRDNTGRTSGTK